MRVFLTVLIAFLLGAAALSLGLVGTTLRTGRIDPLDWLMPGTAAILLLMLTIMIGPRSAQRGWVVVTLPILAFIALAGTHLPWLGMLMLAAGLAIISLILKMVREQDRAMRVGAGVLLVALAFLAPQLADALPGAAPHPDRPLVGIVSTLPLQGAAMGAGQGLPPLESASLRSPLWRTLEMQVRLRPLDALDEAALRPLRTVLLAQPRLLAPAELVAFDAWVRQGGRAVILADPLLHWPDPRPLGDAARAPLTSLLDPLLGHWGLGLEPADLSVEASTDAERRLLTSGALLQLAGASRFSASRAADCVLLEKGLVARCSIGAGQALLVADADWMNDMLWTLHPDHPADARNWIGDAPDQLVAWLTNTPFRVDPQTSWLVDRAALLRGVRAALLLLLALAVGERLVARRPSLLRQIDETKKDHSWNKKNTGGDTG